ncbi:MAG: toll/interleukin-1 receptor domain-containing protein, partial [Gammaproteobacteria bacterium]
MPALFLSHSSADNEIAQRIVQSLRDQRIRSIFLDFDPELGIPVGRNWERELYRQLRITDGILFLSSEKSIASRWCFAELAFARALGKPILPIAVDDTGRHPLLADLQHLTLPNEMDGRGLEQFRRSLRLSGIGSNVPLSWNPDRAPYPGLESFTEEDAAVFFGREDEVRDLFERVNRSLLPGNTRAIVVVGSSGSGKSSLVRAGLVPRLLGMRERWVVIPRMVPGKRPLDSLARSLARACRELGIDAGRYNFAQQLVKNPDCFRTALLDLSERASPSANATCFLFVDQLEELMTLSLPSQRQEFLQLVDTALGSDAPLFLAATLRSEYQDQLLWEPYAAKLISRLLPLAPLDQGRLPQVIEAPADKAGLEFAPGLVARIVHDTQGGDSLPLLNYTLNQLCRRLGSATYISDEIYDELGGVVGALQHQANQVVADLKRQGLTELIVPTLLKL